MIFNNRVAYLPPPASLAPSMSLFDFQKYQLHTTAVAHDPGACSPISPLLGHVFFPSAKIHKEPVELNMGSSVNIYIHLGK